MTDLLGRRWLPAALAAVAAAAYLLVDPRTVDLAAHDYRTALFEREGFGVWNGNWYGGHHTPGYSLLFPPLAALLGPQLVGALAAVAAAALFEPLARRHFGHRARWGAAWFGLTSGLLLFTGRLPFALGIALGLAALLALQRGRTGLAAVPAIGTAFASPVAGLFLAVAAGAHAVGARRPRSTLVVAAALAPIGVLAIAFPEGGRQPFDLPAVMAIVAFVAAAEALLPPYERTLRAGVALYAGVTLLAFAVESPLGGNATRLGALVGGPLLACVLLGPPRRRPALVAAVLLALAFWQLRPAVRDTADAVGDPAAEAAYYEPLLDWLERRSGEATRVEIPFTHAHWEAAEVAPRFPLARGWERQLDTKYNGLFYEGPLDAHSYRRWLAANAVGLVAVPDAELDDAGDDERRLIERGLPYLRERARPGHWRVYEVADPAPFADPPLRAVGVEPDAITLEARAAGAALVRVRWTPYWRVRPGCVERAGDWTRVTVPRPGRARLAIDFSPRRVLERGRRCG